VAIKEPDLYDGVYYCIRCGHGAHLKKLVKSNMVCEECGSRSHISHVDYDLKSIIAGE